MAFVYVGHLASQRFNGRGLDVGAFYSLGACIKYVPVTPAFQLPKHQYRINAIGEFEPERRKELSQMMPSLCH